MDIFWTEYAASLIAECGSDFICTAKVEEVVDRAGADFKAMSPNIRIGVLETARSMLAKGAEATPSRSPPPH